MSKTFLLKDIPEKEWEEFVIKIPRRKSINQAIIELIQKEVKNETKNRN